MGLTNDDSGVAKMAAYKLPENTRSDETKTGTYPKVGTVFVISEWFSE